MSNDFKHNAEGYSDPTAYAALTKIAREEQRLRQLKRIIGEVCVLSGYRLKGQITLVEKQTGHTVRL